LQVINGIPLEFLQTVGITSDFSSLSLSILVASSAREYKALVNSLSEQTPETTHHSHTPFFPIQIITMKAVKISPPGKAVVVNDAPIPELPSPEWVRIKVVAVALNPTDWKHVKGMKVPATVGCDFSGVVEEIGSAVTKDLKKGDRVYALAHGSNALRPDNGSFAEYVCVKGGVTMKIPEGRSFEEFAGSGVGVITVGQGMYQEMPLPWPTEPLKEKVPILIYAGSSGMGAMGIQFAKL
jgi:NADPH:quinone reductase-like Zn-dependent oxidoreductase